MSDQLWPPCRKRLVPPRLSMVSSAKCAAGRDGRADRPNPHTRRKEMKIETDVLTVLSQAEISGRV